MSRISGITGTSSQSFAIDSDGYNIKLSAENNEVVIRDNLNNKQSISTTSGGTGQTTYTTGDMLYSSATNTLSKMSVGSTNQVLTVVGGVPTWSSTIPNLFELNPQGLILQSVTNKAVFDVQPSALLKINETFDDPSLTRFTIISEGTPATPVISGGVMTLTHNAGQNTGIQEGTDLTMCQFCNTIKVVSVTSNSGNTYENFGIGVAKNSSNFIMAVWRRKENSYGTISIQVKISGSSNWYGSITLGAAWTPPFEFGLSLVANSLTVWYKPNAGTWTKITSYDVSSLFNFKTSSLTGWKSTMWLATNNAQTVTAVFDDFKTGYFGSVGFRDPSVVTTEDGYPIVDTSGNVKLTATLTDPQAAAYMGIFDLNILTNVINQVGIIMVNRSGACQNDNAGQIIKYNDNLYKFFITTWGNAGGPASGIQVLYKEESSLNLLSGANVVSGMTQLALSGIPSSGSAYDPWAVKIGNVWYLAYTAGPTTPSTFYPTLNSSTDLSTWTLVGSDPTAYPYEGTRITNLAGSWWVLSSSLSDTNVYDLSMRYAGKMHSPILSNGNPPHPTLIPFNNYVYQVTFDNTLYQSVANTLGNFMSLKSVRYGVNHNTTLNVQGGSFTDGYYHLTGSQRTWLTDGYSDGYWKASKGGTGFTTYTTGDILYSNATNSLAKRSIGVTGQVLTVSGGVPAWANPAVSADFNMEKAVSMGQFNNFGVISTSIVSPISYTVAGLSGRGGLTSMAYLGNGQLILAANDWSPDNSYLSVVRKSYDYGKTWTKKYLAQFNNSTVKSVCYLGNGVCLAGEYNAGKIIYSTDFGETWTRSASSLPGNIFKIIKCKNNVALAFADNGVSSAQVFRSTDLGVTWTSVYSYSGGNGYNNSAIYFGDGYIVASADVSALTNGIRSIDNGLTWSRISIDTGWNDVVSYSWIKNAMVYCGNGICIAAANQNNALCIARSTDYGATWSRTTSASYFISQLLYLGAGRVVAFSNGGGSTYYESIDYGVTWSTKTVASSDLPGDPLSVCYLDDGTILLGISSGYLYRIPLAPTKPILAEQVGGTNQTSYITGDILYASAANTLSKRAIGSTGQVLTVANGIPSWTQSITRKLNWWNSGVTPTSTASDGYHVTISGLIVKPGDPIRILDKSGIVYSNVYPIINSTSINDVTGNILDYRGCLYFKAIAVSDPTYRFDVFSDELCTVQVATTTTFNASVATTYTLTLSSGLTGTISVTSIAEARTPNTINKVAMMHTGICTAYNGTSLTFAGQAISTVAGNILEVWLGNPSLVIQYPIDIAGSYASATTSTAFQDRQLRTPYWDQSNAILCMVKARNTTNDTGATQAKIAMVINGNQVVADGSALTLNTVRVSTVIEMTSNLLDINFGDSLEMRVINGTNSNSQDLQGSAIFVLN